MESFLLQLVYIAGCEALRRRGNHALWFATGTPARLEFQLALARISSHIHRH